MCFSDVMCMQIFSSLFGGYKIPLFFSLLSWESLLSSGYKCLSDRWSANVFSYSNAYLIFRDLDFFQISTSADFLFNFTGLREHIMYDLSPWKFGEICSVAQNMLYLGKHSVCICRGCVLCCCWVECSTHTNQVKLDHSIIQASYEEL